MGILQAAFVVTFVACTATMTVSMIGAVYYYFTDTTGRFRGLAGRKLFLAMPPWVRAFGHASTVLLVVGLLLLAGLSRG